MAEYAAKRMRQIAKARDGRPRAQEQQARLTSAEAEDTGPWRAGEFWGLIEPTAVKASAFGEARRGRPGRKYCSCQTDK